MALNTRAIKTRIKSVKNTKKITKAMEMVSAAKMRRAVESALNTRTYSVLAQELLEHFGQLEEKHSPYLHVEPVKKILAIVVASNRGLCGSFNSNVFKKAKYAILNKQDIATHHVNSKKNIIPHNNDVSIDMVGIGKKSVLFAKRESQNLIAVYDTISDRPRYEEALPIAQFAMQEFKKNTYQKVVVVYTDYVSSLVQEPKIRQLLPISSVDLEKILREIGADTDQDKKVADEVSSVPIDQFLFEPSLKQIMDTILPRLIETQLYQVILESAASEHSARMVAMKSASDAAGDMIDDLTRTFNKARQAAITQEIAEIAGGAAALE